MPTARFLDIELANADIDHYEALEGNIYFAASTVNMKYLKPSDLVTTCGWKGDANYFDVVYTNQDGVECKNANAAWVYRTPKKGAEHIKGTFFKIINAMLLKTTYHFGRGLCLKDMIRLT